jgi:hypothetical protein
MTLRDAKATGAAPKESDILEDCHRAARLRPQDPAPWVLMLSMMRMQGRPHQQVRNVWREITTRDPWHREAHLEMLGYLSPAEQGSHMSVLDFIDSRHAQMPAGAAPSGLRLTATVQEYQRNVRRGGLDEIMAGSHWNNPVAASALDEALSLWLQPHSLRHAAAIADLNVLTFVLVASRRFTDSAAAFRAVKGLVTPWPWRIKGEPVGEFTRWQSRCWR